MYNIPLDANIIDYKVKPSLVTTAIDESCPLPNLDLGIFIWYVCVCVFVRDFIVLLANSGNPL